MKQYDPKKIEKKWQKYWEDNQTFRAEDKSGKPKKYVLVEFPYPSGEGLHMGHLRPYVAGDVYSRYWRLKGEDVLYPMGWDAFGLPAENFAIKRGVHPRVSTAQNVQNAKRQIQSWGLGFDWSREVNTTDPEYYKWTQWIFLQLYKAGLAYEATGLINWCPEDKTGLANEEVIDGKCDRCGTVVEKKELRQWYLKITAYADKLLAPLKSIGLENDSSTNQNYNYIILPGWTSGKNDNFYPWLAKKLSLHGASSEIIVYKRLDEVPETEVMEDLTAKVKLNENSVLIGHSLGGVMSMKLLEKSKTKIAKLVLVASFANPNFKDQVRPFAANANWNFDFDAIKQNVGEIIILHDKNDHIVPESSAIELAEKLDGRLVKFEAKQSHVTGEQEPEVLKAINKERYPSNLSEWPEPVKLQQANWIGKSQGVTWKQKVKDLNIEVESYDSVPQTFMAQTFCVIAPEHPLVKKLVEGTGHEKPVLDFIEQLNKRKAADRFKIDTEIEGVFTGRYIDNPFGTGDLPIWIASFVIADYGTGIVNASAHDERDFAFAKKFGIPLRPVMFPEDPETAEKVKNLEFCYHHDPEAIMQQPAEFKGRKWGEAREDIIDYVENKGFGYRTSNYKLRDWVFSRQRYWGEPIPLVHCEKCGIVPVPDDQLPVILPEVENYEPTGTGESPLAGIAEWVNTTCPKCSGPAKRETNTMPQWAGSSWYYLRYTDPKNDKEFAGQDLLKKWLPVDVYFGGMEHTTLHLLYSRFWHLALYDQDLVPTPEPYAKRVPHGIVLASDGEKMSKSRGNVVNPDEIVNSHGADTLRMYELFLGPHEAMVSWNDKGIVGVQRFYERIWKWVHEQSKNPAAADNDAALRPLHQLIKKVGDDIESFRFNTAVAAFMNFHNQVKDEPVSSEFLKTFLVLLYPFAPHIAEELNEILGGSGSLQNAKWPDYDRAFITNDTWEIVVQVNGKIKEKLSVPANTAQTEIEQKALAVPKIVAALEGKTLQRVVYVPGKLVNIVL